MGVFNEGSYKQGVDWVKETTYKMVKWAPPIGQVQTEARGQISPSMWPMDTSLPGHRTV